MLEKTALSALSDALGYIKNKKEPRFRMSEIGALLLDLFLL